MQSKDCVKKKIIAYGMIVLLLVNLLSSSLKMNVVTASGETGEASESIKITGLSDYQVFMKPESGNLSISFSYEYKETYPEGTLFQYELTKEGQNEPVKTVTLEQIADSVSLDIAEQADYKIIFKAVSQNKEELASLNRHFRVLTDAAKAACNVAVKDKATGQETASSNSEITVEYALDNLDCLGLYRKIEVDNGSGTYEVLEGKAGEVSLTARAGSYSKTAGESFVAEEGKTQKYRVTYHIVKEVSGSKEQVGQEIVKEFTLDKSVPEVSFVSNVNEAKTFQSVVNYTPVVGEDNCSIKVCGKRTYLSEEGSTDEMLEYAITADHPDVSFERTGNYEIYTWTADAAGNVAESKRLTFSIDKEKPEIVITGAEAGKHYGEDKVDLVFTLKDLNVSEKKECYGLNVEKDGEKQENAVQWDVKKSECTAKGVLSLSKEGSYHIEMTGEDAAGNKDTASLDFVIDRTAPLAAIAVSHDNNQNGEPVVRQEEVQGQSGKANVYYLKDDAKLDFNVTELYHEGTEIYIGSSLNGADFEEKCYSMERNPEIIPVVYGAGGQEGRYETYVWAKDAAGNLVGKDKETGLIEADYRCHFVIDRTAPKFTIAGAKGNNSFYSLGTVLVLTAEDVNHDLDTYNIKVTRTDNNGVITTQSYEGSEGWSVKDDLRVQYNLKLLEEGNYVVELTGKDKSGNEGVNDKGEAAKVSFRVDVTAPSIALSSVQEGACYGNDVPLLIHIRDLNYTDTDASITITRELGEEKEVTTNPISLEQFDTEFEQVFTEDGSYTICVNAKDAAGNEAVPGIVHFVIDKSAPALEITGVGDGAMSREAVTLNLRARDYNHDFSRYTIVVTRSDIEEELESETYVYPAEQWAQEGADAVKKLTISKEGRYRISFDAVDKADNTAATAGITFTIDHTAPVISGVVYSDTNGSIGELYHNIYSNKAIMVEFMVKDQISGVNDQRIYVTVGKPGQQGADSKMYMAHKRIGNYYYVYIPTDLSVSEFNDTITIWANDMLNNEKSYTSLNIVFNTQRPAIHMDCDTDYTKWTNQDVTFHTTVSDEKAGIKQILYRVNNKMVKMISFADLTTSYSCDVTAIESASKVTGYTVSVEVINNCGTSNIMEKRVYIDKVKPKVSLSGVQNGAHYNASQTFTTSVQDVSYSQTKTVYMINRTLDGKTFGTSAAVFHSGKYEDSCGRKMVKEGRYKIYAVTTDGAGNRTVSNTISFVIDKTAPKLSIDGVSDGAMSGSLVNLEFGCEESFFATNHILIDVERTLDGKTVKNQITGFPKSAKKSTFKHSFTEDGTYRVTMSATDKAGNVAAVRTVTFSVDRTKPEIRFAGTDNYQQWKEPATIQFVVEESYYAKNHIEIQGTCTDMDGNVTDVELPDFASTGKVSRLTKQFDKDGIYEFRMISKDEAGNSESGEIHFTIDQTNPEIRNIKQYNGGYYQQFKLADSLEDIFKDLTVVSYKILLNGIEYDGVTKVEEEGKYALEVEVTDEVGHITNEAVEFIIDHTAPKVIFNGAKDGGEVRDSGIITLSLTNTEDEITAVRMNGVDYGADVRSLSYDEYGSYQIDVDCIDKAGNAVTRSLYFVYKHPMINVILFGGMGILTVCGLVWLWVRRKNKRGTKA